MTPIHELLHDRLQVNSLLIVLCFVAALSVPWPAAANVPAYLLAALMLITWPEWSDIGSRRLLWLIMILLGYLCLSSLWSETVSAPAVLRVFLHGGLVLTFVIAFAECQMRGQLRRWVGRSMAVAGIITVIAALALFYVFEPADGRLRGLGLLANHVVAAWVYAVVLILVLDVALSDRSGLWRLIALASALLLAWTIFLSDSRNAWFSTLIGVGVFLMARLILDPQRFVAGVAAFAAVLGVVVGALVANVPSRSLLVPRGTSFRPEIWGDAVGELLRGGPWFGLGINTPSIVMVEGIEFEHPYSMYLSVAYQGGLVGLALFLALIAAVLIVLIRNYQEPDAKLALGILGLALPAYLLDGHHLVADVGATWFLFWLPVAIGLGISWRWLPRGL
ncbi:MAG: O-antigen ligase family protein [Pseudomonadales bacterium]